jgi:amphiphysin
MQEKLQSFADGKYDLSRNDVENVYFEQRGDAAEHLEELTITKRMVSTGEALVARTLDAYVS